MTESQRHTERVTLRLPAPVMAALRAFAARERTTIAGAVAVLVERAGARRRGA